MNDLYGWFTEPGAAQPDYDPPHDAPCPYCGERLTAHDVRTHSFMGLGSADRSYFYRTHSSCDDAASEAVKQATFGAVIERVTVGEGSRP
jgi:hypothetical protein